MKHDSIALTWALSTLGGYGIYGIQLALQFLRRGGKQFIATHKPGAVLLPAMTQARLTPITNLAVKISEVMQHNPSEILSFNHPALYAVGNECGGFAGQDRVRGSVNVGCAAIEHIHFSPSAHDYAKNYDMLVAISRWNESFLKGLDVAPVHLCYQGIDTSLFYPAPSTTLWSNRFVIFSGGKFEFRKGQDIVVAAFKRFREKHPEALLVTAWHTLLPADVEAFSSVGHCKTVPQIQGDRGLQVTAWLLSQGLPADSFIDIPYTPNMLMPPVLRECNAALFPNRCEGGTNLVAMEAMACGIPTCVSNNTGQKDLVDLLGCTALNDQRPVQQVGQLASTEGWGESNVDEVVEFLERLYSNHTEEKAKALAIAEKIKAWDWSIQNEKMLSLICD